MNDISHWIGTKHSGRRSPNAAMDVRARVVSERGRTTRLDIFISKATREALGWPEGGEVAPEFATDRANLLARIRLGQGLRATRSTKKSESVRICITGAPVVSGSSHPVASYKFAIVGGLLTVMLPKEWADMARWEKWA